jgi:hypothetical protein
MTTDEGQALAGRVLGALSALVPLGIIAVDADGRVWYHNQRWEYATGTSISEQIDHHWF